MKTNNNKISFKALFLMMTLMVNVALVFTGCHNGDKGKGDGKDVDSAHGVNCVTKDSIPPPRFDSVSYYLTRLQALMGTTVLQSSPKTQPAKVALERKAYDSLLKAGVKLTIYDTTNYGFISMANIIEMMLEWQDNSPLGQSNNGFVIYPAAEVDNKKNVVLRMECRAGNYVPDTDPSKSTLNFSSKSNYHKASWCPNDCPLIGPINNDSVAHIPKPKPNPKPTK